MSKVLFCVCALASCSLLACAGDDDDDTSPGLSDASTPAADASAGADAETDAGAASQLFGGFAIKLVPAVPATATAKEKQAYTSVIGKVFDADTPQAIVWELADQAEGCELRTPRVPFCDPGCGGSATCTEDDQCTDNPTSLDVGDVEVSGLGPAPFSMEWVADNYQNPESSQWPYPPCAEGDAIDVTTASGAPVALALQAPCIAPLESDGALAIATGKPLMLEWTAPSMPSSTRMHVELDISHHGGAKGVVECDVDDDGAFAIPAKLVDQLVELGVAGFPSVLLTRMSSDHGESPATANVSLLVSSSVEHAVEIPGVRSCSDDSECEDGEICQGNATCK